MQTVRWGLLSTANINRRVIPAIRQSRRGELVAVASRSKDSAISYAKEWDIPVSFESYEAMLASDKVDAIYISLPNQLHAEWAIRSMEAGKHVLCEKPMALTLNEVDRMTAVSQKTGMVLAEAFMYRHHPQTKMIGEWVQNGLLGTIKRIEASFSFHLTYRDNIRLQPELGGGSLWDIGVYPVSFAQFVMGSAPTAVLGYQQIGDSGVDEQFFGQLLYSDGAVAQINCSFQLPYHTQAHIFGTKGKLIVERPFTNIAPPHQIIRFVSPQDEVENLPLHEEYLYLGQVEDMHAAILDGAEPYLSLNETRQHIETVLALYQSAKNGRWLNLFDT